MLVYRDFAEKWTFCWACGIEPDGWSGVSQPLRGHEPTDYWRYLEIAHIIGGPMRVENKKVLCRLCKLCHALNHGATIRTSDHRVLPHLRIDHMMWLKNRFDGPLDRKFLQTLRERKLPPTQSPPAWFSQSYSRRRWAYPGPQRKRA